MECEVLIQLPEQPYQVGQRIDCVHGNFEIVSYADRKGIETVRKLDASESQERRYRTTFYKVRDDGELTQIHTVDVPSESLTALILGLDKLVEKATNLEAVA